MLRRRGGKRNSNNCVQARRFDKDFQLIPRARAPTGVQKRINDLGKITDSPKTHETSLRCRRDDPHFQPAFLVRSTTALTLSFYATQRAEYTSSHDISFITSHAFVNRAKQRRETTTLLTKSEKRDASSRTRRHLQKSVSAINYRYDRYKSNENRKYTRWRRLSIQSISVNITERKRSVVSVRTAQTVLITFLYFLMSKYAASRIRDDLIIHIHIQEHTRAYIRKVRGTFSVCVRAPMKRESKNHA